MHAQQLPSHAAPPIPMMPHPSLAGATPSTAASLLGLSGALGPPGQHQLSMLPAKHDLHRSDDVKSNSGVYILGNLLFLPLRAFHFTKHPIKWKLNSGLIKGLLKGILIT